MYSRVERVIPEIALPTMAAVPYHNSPASRRCHAAHDTGSDPNLCRSVDKRPIRPFPDHLRDQSRRTVGFFAPDSPAEEHFPRCYYPLLASYFLHSTQGPATGLKHKRMLPPVLSARQCFNFPATNLPKPSGAVSPYIGVVS